MSTAQYLPQAALREARGPEARRQVALRGVGTTPRTRYRSVYLDSLSLAYLVAFLERVVASEVELPDQLMRKYGVSGYIAINIIDRVVARHGIDPPRQGN